MNLPNKTFCVLPWVSLEASPIGTVRPCCLADEEIINDDGVKCNLNDDSLMKIQDTVYMYRLRKEFLAGKKPKTCRKCWDEEAVGRTSKRMNTQTRLEHMLSKETQWGPQAKNLYFLDLKLGNICNLKCRICGSWSSSTFAGEEIKFSADPTFHKSMNKQGAWPRNNTKFWEELDFLSTDIRYLEFTGGEPFMIKEHFEYLEMLIKHGHSSNIEIHYNTNGTQWPEKYLHVWRHFKHVEIAFSIDNIGERFEYERTNAKWDEVNLNLEKFIELRDISSNISLQLCTTINIYNVLYLHEIVQWDHFLDFDYVHWNMLHDAPENSIRSLPDNVKHAACLSLISADVPDDVTKEFESVVKFMKGHTTVTHEELLANINKLDSRREVSLKDTHPELYTLLYE